MHKRTEATVTRPDGKTFKVTKGAPQVILAMSANADVVKSAVTRKWTTWPPTAIVRSAWRVQRRRHLAALGVLPLFDPPRVDATSTIATAAQKGIKIKMVTGDDVAIGREIAKTLGLG